MISLDAPSSTCILRTGYPSISPSTTKASSKRSRANTDDNVIGTFIYFSSVFMVFLFESWHCTMLISLPFCEPLFRCPLFPFALHPSPDDLTYRILKLSLMVLLPTVLVVAGAVDVPCLKSLEEYLPMNLVLRPLWFPSAGETPARTMWRYVWCMMLLRPKSRMKFALAPVIEPCSCFAIKGLLKHPTPDRHESFPLVFVAYFCFALLIDLDILIADVLNVVKVQEHGLNEQACREDNACWPRPGFALNVLRAAYSRDRQDPQNPELAACVRSLP
nr:hypothetical protein [Tanacetum cinerariifolium]